MSGIMPKEARGLSPAATRVSEDQETTFEGFAKTCMELNDKKKQRDQVAKKIREICHG